MFAATSPGYPANIKCCHVWVPVVPTEKCMGFSILLGDLCEGISPACGRDAPPDIGRTSKHEAPNSAPGDRPDIKPKFVKQLGTDIHRISNKIGFNSKAAHQLGRGVLPGRHLMCCFGQCKARKQHCVDVCHLGPQSVFAGSVW